MKKQFAKTLLELGSDERLVVLIGDIGHFLLKDFERAYPARFYNLGIAEQGMMGLAAGLAMKGFCPVVHSITPFVTERCFEQIKDDLCYQELGVNIVSVGSAFDYTGLGVTHHCYEDIGILRTLPHMEIVYPAAPHEFDTLFRETYADGKPTYFRLPTATHRLETHPKFGEAERLAEGNDLTLVAAGPQIQNAYDAAEELRRDGVRCDVLYLTTIKPLHDSAKQLLRESLARTGRLITVEEHTIYGGIGDVVAEVGGGRRFLHKRLGIRDKFLTNFGTYEEHCRANGLTKENILETAYGMLRIT